MATLTEHYNLQKPDKTDKYNIDVNNANADLIDAALHSLDLKETTKEDIGLGNVENKSSEQIRAELTKENVTNALGYTPYTPDEVNEKWKQNSDTESGYVPSSNGQPHKVYGTDENGMPGWINMISAEGDNCDCGIAPQNVSNINIQLGVSSLTIFWSDPDDTIVGNQPLCTWGGTKLVMKIGAYPESVNDGILLVDNKIKNNYKINGFHVENLTNETTYYFSLFPYSDTGKININEENRISGIPKYYRIMTVNIDLNNSNPETCITYADDAINMTPGSDEWDEFFGHYPVLFKNGEEVGRLNPNNFGQFENGETVDITSGDAGDVMIAFPCKGIKMSKNTITNVLTISMTENVNDKNYKYYAHTRGENQKEKFYLGAYKGCVNSELLRSLSNAILSIDTLEKFRIYANANGVGYDQFGWHQLIFIQIMYILKYKNLDSQTAIGTGTYLYVNYNNAVSGTLNQKGMDFYDNSNTSNQPVKLFGIERLWGTISEWIEGISLINENEKTINVTLNNEQFSDTGGGLYTNIKTLPNLLNTGCISNIWDDLVLGFLPSETKGSYTTFFCDWYDYGSSGYSLNYYVFCFGSNRLSESAGIKGPGIFSSRFQSHLNKCSSRLMFL